MKLTLPLVLTFVGFYNIGTTEAKPISLRGANEEMGKEDFTPRQLTSKEDIVKSIEEVSIDIGILLGVGDIPSDPEELKSIMLPFLLQVRGLIKKNSPDLNIDSVSDEELLDLFLSRPSSSEVTPPDDNGHRALADSSTCLTATNEILSQCMRAVYHQSGNWFSAAQGYAAGEAAAAELSQTAARQYGAFRGGNFPTTDEGLKDACLEVFKFAHETIGLNRMIEIGFSVWPWYEQAIWAAGYSAMMGAIAVDALYLNVFGVGWGTWGQGGVTYGGTAYTLKEYLKVRVIEFNANCNAI